MASRKTFITFIAVFFGERARNYISPSRNIASLIVYTNEIGRRTLLAISCGQIFGNIL